MRAAWELGRVAIVIVVTAVAGLALAGLLGGSDEGAGTGPEGEGAVLGARAGSDSAEGAATGVAATGPAARPAIRVRDATLAPATTAGGRARNRARVTLAIRVSNPSGAPVPLAPTLIAGRRFVRADPRAPGTLAGDVPAGGEVAGVLRFELAGGQTSAVRSARRVQVRAGGARRTVPVAIAAAP